MTISSPRREASALRRIASDPVSRRRLFAVGGTGAAAAFLSIRREFIGHPDDVKRIFTSTATSLGRESYFQGHGLLDLMRAIQSV